MNEPYLNLWLIPILPLIAAAINGLLGKRFSPSILRVRLHWRHLPHDFA